MISKGPLVRALPLAGIGAASQSIVGDRVMRVAVFVCCLLLTVPVTAQAADERYTVFGPAIDSCGSWTQGRGLINANGNYPLNRAGADQLAREAWGLGYIASRTQGFWTTTGLNMARGMDVHALFAWIDNYCAANPLSEIVVAANALADELENRARNR